MKNITTACGVIGGLLLIGTSSGAQETAQGAAHAPRMARLVQIDGARAQGRAPARGARPPLGPEVTESFSRTVKLGSKNGFELATGLGQVTITGTSGDDVRIEAVKRVRHQNADAGRALLQRVAVRISERGGLVEALTEITRAGQPVFVDYTISLPSRAAVGVKTFGGDIRVTNVKGELRIEAAGGNITLSSVGAIRKAKTLVGTVTITDAEGDDINAETTSGTLQVRNVRAESIELGAVTGNIIVSDVRCDRCTMKTISGNIEFTGPLVPGGRYDMQSNSGNVRLVPTGPASFDIEARTYGGKINSEFPLTASPGNPSREGILRGSYGDESGAILSLTSFTGSVTVARK